MKKRLVVTVVALTVALHFGACSDDDVKKDSGTDQGADIMMDDVGTDDTGGNDATSDMPPVKPDLPLNSNMGEGCKVNTDCKAGSPVCIMHPSYKTQVQVCSKKCTPDDSSTPLINEDDCADGFICASFRYSTATYNYCLKKCTPSLTKNPCPASSGTTCSPESARWGSMTQATCFEPACAKDKDCPVLAAKTCLSDTDCTSVGTTAFCDTTSGQCAKPGVCSAGGLCGPHKLGKSTAKVGDACSSDFDCPGAGKCQMSSTGSSSIGTDYNNGYCIVRWCSFSTSMSDFKCPTGSSCDILFYGGWCMKSCKLAGKTDCRNYSGDKGGDYECYAWNNLSLSGSSISATPVCTSSAGQTCDSLGTTMDCSSLGNQGNPTKMSCRDRYTGVAKTLKKDPTGVCLDDTASGTFVTPMDAGVDGVTAPDMMVDSSTPAPDVMMVDSSTPAPDMGVDAAAKLTCAQIQGCYFPCAATCTTMACQLACSTTCSTNGCASAVTAWGNFLTCVASNCATPCAAPTSTACQTCVGTSCGALAAACTANTCP